MAGTPDWKPGLHARPSSLAGSSALVPVTPVTLRASPSSIDMSGRYEHAPISSQVSETQPKHVLKRAICDVDDEDKPCNRRARIRGTPSFGGAIFGGDARVPVEPQPRPHTGSTVDPGWKTGAYFRHIIRPGLSHRVYDGPPDGTARVRIAPEEIMVDFARPYQIHALFVNDVYLAAQIKIPKQWMMSGLVKPSTMVWSNIRRGDDWWAKLIDPDVGRELERVLSHEMETDEQQHDNKGSLIIKRLASNTKVD